MKEDKSKENKEEKVKNPITEIEKQLEECKKQKEEYLNGWKRERADFINYKKEEIERITELIKYANEGLILKILPILDNCLAAEKNIPDDLKKDEHVKGLLQIHQQMRGFLKSQGLEEIKTMGEKFDPNFMEAVEEIENKDKIAGVIIEEIQKGYTLHGQIIRPAKVKVTK